jgi:serine-type D-Ala-D-Ala carboxypeptidase (penicillin-binding protein 5/6)
MKYVSYFSTVLLLSILVVLGYWLFGSAVSPRIAGITSPLPDFLTIAKNKQVNLLDFWLPSVEKSEGSEAVSDLTAQAVLIYDLGSGKTLYEREAKKKMPMASLTKVMTAVISLENKRADDRYAVKADAIVGENSMGVSIGEVFTLEDLLYGLMLPSGNDAAEVLATNYPGGRVAFITAMNNKAKALALSDTNFTNPSGLQGDGDQYTTAYDLLVITRYAIENFPEFIEVTSTYEHHIPQSQSHKEFYLYNETNLLTSYEGVKGVKTGYTPEAGLCLITYLEYDGHRVLGVLLNSESRREEMKALLDYSLTTLGSVPPPYRPPALY